MTDRNNVTTEEKIREWAHDVLRSLPFKDDDRDFTFLLRRAKELINDQAILARIQEGDGCPWFIQEDANSGKCDMHGHDLRLDVKPTPPDAPCKHEWIRAGDPDITPEPTGYACRYCNEKRPPDAPLPPKRQYEVSAKVDKYEKAKPNIHVDAPPEEGE